MILPLLIAVGVVYAAYRTMESESSGSSEGEKEPSKWPTIPELDAFENRDAVVEGLAPSACVKVEGVSLSWCQLNLMLLHYLPVASGILGVCKEETRAATSDFQKLNGLPVTGVFDKKTVAVLPGYWTVRPIGDFRLSGEDKKWAEMAYSVYGIAGSGAFDASSGEFTDLAAVVRVKQGQVSEVLMQKPSSLPKIMVGQSVVMSAYERAASGFRRYAYSASKGAWVWVSFVSSEGS